MEKTGHSAEVEIITLTLNRQDNIFYPFLLTEAGHRSFDLDPAEPVVHCDPQSSIAICKQRVYGRMDAGISADHPQKLPVRVKKDEATVPSPDCEIAITQREAGVNDAASQQR